MCQLSNPSCAQFWKSICQRKKDQQWLFPGSAELKNVDGRWRENAQFLSQWRKIVVAAKEKTKSKAAFWDYGTAEWRHTAATAMGHSGCSALQITQWIGNSESMCRRHYIAPIGARRWALRWE